MAAKSTFKPLKDEVNSALIDLTRTAGKIAAEDLAFQRSSNPAITPLLDKQNRRLLHIVRDLTRASTLGTEVQAPSLSDVDSLEEQWHGLVDVFDSLLEKADACLDEYTGVIKKRDAPPESTDTTTRKALPPRSYRSQTLAKPQLAFQKAPQNHETAPFKPLLRSKPHAIRPLQESLQLANDGDGREQYDSFGPEQGMANNLSYEHPYQAEIEALRYPEFIYHNDIPIPFLPFESTAATFVDTPEAVAAMLQELKSAKEIAIDLEHHDTHSYLGLTSLMQISTRYQDWVVDTLKPWREDLQILNEVFADPDILKVFHGAFMDMIWLQRDLGLYVVGLFDTFHASRTLGYPKNSLAVLLARHANFNAAKQYQMADWRIRPLPEAMFNYARSDTHFLLYVYDNLRNELLEKSNLSAPDGDLIGVVLRKSKEESLQRFERPVYDAQHGTGSNGWYNILSHTPALLNPEQFAVFRAVHQWRDTIARLDDESLNSIMPKHVIYNIAREMPTEMAALLGCSQPISTFVRSRAGELLGIVKQAKLEGRTGPDLMQVLRAAVSTASNLQYARAPAAASAIAMSNNVLAPTTLHVASVTKSVSDVLPNESVPQAPEATNRTSSRITISAFWGSILKFGDSPEGQNSHSLPKTDSVCLALPLPQLTAAVFEDQNISPGNGPPDTEADPGARAEHAYVKERKPKEEEVFIVRQVGGTRKRKAADIENHPEPPEPILASEVESAAVNGDRMQVEQQELSLDEVDEDQTALEKAERKADRRAQKKLEKKRRKLEAQKPYQKNGMEGEAAFDYANAPSVLHADKEVNHKRPGAKEAFDPYTKSLDAPKGLGRSRREVPGKSFTFKS